MKKKYIIIPLLIFIGIGLFISPYIIDASINSHNLDLMKKRIEALPHPDQSEPVLTHSRVGLLIGNGNHCDYFVGHVRSFDGNKDLIQNHYSNFTFLNPVTERYEDWDILFFDDASLPDAYLPYEFDSLRAWQVKEYDLTKLYALSIFRSYDANSDPRCH